MIDYRTLAEPCFRSWTPRTCRSTATDPAAVLRSPIDHVCWQSRSRPHVCFCVRCGDRTVRVVPPTFRLQGARRTP